MGSQIRFGSGLAVASLLLVLTGCGTGHTETSGGQAVSPTSSPLSTSSTTAASGPSPSSGTSVPPTSAAGTAPTSSAAVASGCLATQLSVQIGEASGAAGSVGYTNDFKNVSNTTCTLYGYPGLQMLNASGQPISTDVIRATSVTVPYVPEKLVTLVPGAKADFDMGFAAATGYENADCPTSTRVEFTAPNDFQSLIVALAIRPYGGADVAQLHCGEIHVSPVYAAS
jgi:Protein of unknown function (DUF4232)